MEDFMAKVTTSAKMLLTGFTVVFAVLILLIFIIYAYGTIVYNAQNKSKAKKEAKLKEQQKNTAPVVPTPVASTASSNEIPDEIVAVIAAAVDSIYGQSGTKVKIKNIKKSNGRNAWANAGILNNTRPF